MLYLISKLIIIFIALIYLFIHDNFGFYFIASLILVTSLIIHYSFKNKRKLFIYQLIDFKIIDWFEPVIVLGIYFLTFIVGILFIRLWRMGNSSDMKFMLIKLYLYVCNETYFHLLFKVIFILLILICVYKSFTYFFKQVNLNFNKIILHPLIFNVYYKFSNFALGSRFFEGLVYKVLNKIHWSNNKLENFEKRSEILNKPSISILLAFLTFLDEYLGNIALFIAFIYDILLNNMKLTMVFYVLPFAFIYMQYIKFIAYVIRKDFLEKDKLLSTYLYKRPSHILFNGMHCDNNVVLYKEDLNEFVEYMKKDFMEYENKEYNSIPLLRGLRIIILLLSIVMLIYLIIYFKVFLVITINENFIYKISFSYITLGMLIILFYLWWKTRICFNNTGIKEVSLKLKLLSKLFWILSLFLNLLIIYILLTHRIVLMYNEVLFDYNYIKIIQEYTLTEKLNFIYFYVDYLLYVDKYPIFTKMYIINILKIIDFNTLVTEEISIEKLKEFLDNLFPDIQRMQDTYYISPCLDEHYYNMLFILLSPFIVVTYIVGIETIESFILELIRF